MEDIVIIGAGGFGREIQWLIERINQEKYTWNVLGYIDDNVKKNENINGYRVLGTTEMLRTYDEPINVVCAIGTSQTREKIVEKLLTNKNVKFPNLIDPDARISNSTVLGIGNIVCAGTIITIDVVIKDFTIVNLNCTVGHDCLINSFVTIYPNANVSGKVIIGECSEIGTGVQIIQGKKVCKKTILGAGSVIIDDILQEGTYVGVPAKFVRKDMG